MDYYLPLGLRNSMDCFHGLIKFRFALGLINLEYFQIKTCALYSKGFLLGNGWASKHTSFVFFANLVVEFI